jgi:hypothetical protein
MFMHILALMIANFFPIFFLVVKNTRVDSSISSLTIAIGFALGFDFAFSFDLVYLLEKLR